MFSIIQVVNTNLLGPDKKKKWFGFKTWPYYDFNLYGQFFNDDHIIQALKDLLCDMKQLKVNLIIGLDLWSTCKHGKLDLQ